MNKKIRVKNAYVYYDNKLIDNVTLNDVIVDNNMDNYKYELHKKIISKIEIYFTYEKFPETAKQKE